MKAKIKKGDTVVVIAGAHKGKQGKVLNLNPGERVVVQGVRMLKKHRAQTSADSPAGVVQVEGPIHYSNVMLLERYESRQTRKGKSLKKIAE